MIYFDFNATAPVMREAREAWLETTEKIGGNPSSMHQYGARAGRAMADAREKLAAFLGCHPLDIVWTSGATEIVVKAAGYTTSDETYTQKVSPTCKGPIATPILVKLVRPLDGGSP